MGRLKEPSRGDVVAFIQERGAKYVTSTEVMVPCAPCELRTLTS